MDERTVEQQILGAWGVPYDIKIQALNIVLYKKKDPELVLHIICQLRENIALLHSWSEDSFENDV